MPLLKQKRITAEKIKPNGLLIFQEEDAKEIQININ